MWRNSICLGWKFLSESKLFGEGHWRFLAIWNLCHPAMRIFLPQYVTSRFYIVKGVPPPVFPWKIVWAKKPPHKRKTPKLFSKNWPKRAEIKVFGVKVLFLASSSYQSFLVTPPGPLTLLAPGGGALCPPCYVFAYICANTRTSPLKKLDFSQLWVWKRAVPFFPRKFISFPWKKIKFVGNTQIP